MSLTVDEKHQRKVEYQREYRKRDAYIEQNREYQKSYRQTVKGIKNKRLCNWRKSGVLCEDFNELYTYYINTWICENCDCPLVEGIFGANKRVLDHDHDTGLFRNVLCNTCNIRRK